MDAMPIKIAVVVKAEQAMASFKGVNGELDKMEAKGKLAAGSLGNVQRAGKYAGVALMGLAGIAGLVAYQGVKAATALQKSQTNLQVAVKNSGVSWSVAQPYIQSYQEKMANLGFTTEDTNTALAHVTAATRSPKMALNALGVEADLARFKNESLATAADTVSRAAMGQARGLASLGLAIGKTIPKGASFAQIMALIEAKTHGAATAFASTSTGQLAVLQAKFKQLQEQLGVALLPTLTKVSDWLIKTGLPALKNIGTWIGNNKGTFVGLATTLTAIWAVPKVAALITAIGTIAGAWTGVATAAKGAAAAEATASGGLLGALFAPAAVALGGSLAFHKAIGAPLNKAMASGGSLSMQGAINAQTKNSKAGNAAAQNKAMQQKGAYYVMDAGGNLINIGGGGIKGGTSSPAGSIAGLGPVPLISSSKTAKTAKPKKLSLRTQARQKVGGATPITVHSTIVLDNKVVAKAVAKSAIHGTALSGGKSK